MMTSQTTRPANAYRAYDTVTAWMGRERPTMSAAEYDAHEHNAGCVEQGGYGSAIVVTPIDGICHTLDGSAVWPSHGRSSGAVRWPA